MCLIVENLKTTYLIMTKKLPLRLAVLLCAITLTINSFGQAIFSENFNSANALTNWTLINNDGATPNASVSFVNDAWVLTQDSSATETAAISTSWYTPADTADDYLISPSIALTTNNIVKWQARAGNANFPDGYELLISTTTPTIAGFSANPPLFSTTAENGTWTDRQVDLAAAGYSNQTVYLAWRNNTFDGVALLVDNILVEAKPKFDVELTAIGRFSNQAISTVNQTLIPAVVALINNNGSSALSNVKLKYQINRNNAQIFEDSIVIASLASGADSVVFDVLGFTPTQTGTYNVSYSVSHDSTDMNLTNNALVSDSLVVGDTIISNTTATASLSSLGIGANTSGELGSIYRLLNPDTLSSVQVYIVNGSGQMTNQPLSANIRSVVNGLPGPIIASTDTITYTNTAGSMVTLNFSHLNNQVILPADSFFVGVVERDSNVTIGTSPTKFTQNSNFVIFGTNPWRPNEAFNFNVTYIIRAIFNSSVLTSIESFEEINSELSVYPNPSNGLININIDSPSKEAMSLFIHDLQGKVVYENRLIESNKYNNTLNLNHLDKGIYFIQLRHGKNITTKKLILK